MRLSISRSQESIWVWLFWGLGIYLALETGPFLLALLVFGKTAGELAGPYLAFAAPALVIMSLVWWLRKWEEMGVSPKRLAHGWGLSMVLFGIGIGFAVFYSGVQLHVISLEDAVISFVVMILLSGPMAYFVMYLIALPRISSRAAGKLGGSQPE